MAAANNKELLQALAYSYFAKNPFPVGNADAAEIHLTDWYLLFRNVKHLKSLGSHLSKTFNYQTVFNDYQATTTEKTNEVKINPHVKITYNVAKKLYESKLLGDMSEYDFLDQGDPFVVVVKDDSLKRLIKVFRLATKADILSAVDIFAVRKTRKKEVQSEYENHIINAPDAEILSNLSYGKTGKNTYRTITNKLFFSRDLIGISLKMPVAVSVIPHLSIIGTTVGLLPEQVQYVDPYTKFLSVVMGHVDVLESTIKKLIKFVAFDYRDNVNAWKAEVEFDYKALSLMDFNINFQLLAWAGVGYNGKFKRGLHTSEQFVGGASFTAAEEFLRQYPEYATITKELKTKRKVAFAFALAKGIPAGTLSPSSFAKIKSLFDAAKTQLEYAGVVSGIRQNAAIKAFSDKFDTIINRKEKTWDIYRGAVIRLCKNESITVPFTGGSAPLEKNYHNAQGFWFLNRGGDEYLKQRIFLTLFGLVTKKGFMIYDNSLNSVRAALHREFTVAGKKLFASLDAAPHILMS